MLASAPKPKQAIDLISGEVSGDDELNSVNCIASPPSIETLHTRRVRVAGSKDVNSTHFPSGEHRGALSSAPFVSCLGLAPSMSILQILCRPERSEAKTTCWPSGVTDGVESLPASTVSCF